MKFEDLKDLTLEELRHLNSEVYLRIKDTETLNSKIFKLKTGYRLLADTQFKGEETTRILISTANHAVDLDCGILAEDLTFKIQSLISNKLEEIKEKLCTSTL